MQEGRSCSSLLDCLCLWFFLVLVVVAAAADASCDGCGVGFFRVTRI